MTRVPVFSNPKQGQAAAMSDAHETTARIRETIAETAVVAIQPLASRDGLIVKVQPPMAPEHRHPSRSHVPCDIVLVIDVSGSMGSDAPAPSNAGAKAERNGLSVLDLTKHAARTILETLDDSDRLGIVTFATKAKAIQPLMAMTKAGRKDARSNIEGMQPMDSTNLWHGILEGLRLFNGEINTGRLPALMVLTDGMPNHMCPPQGYVPKLKQLAPLPATIHTFGFGYNLRSGLLKSIAEIGGGNYAFIPDAGMIGTVFVHAVANLQSTFANDASLRLTYPSHVTLHQTLGKSVDQQEAVSVDGGTQLMISLGNLQYGQSRDIYLRYENHPTDRDDFLAPPIITTTLQYRQMTAQMRKAVALRSLLDIAAVSEAEEAYHISRSALCTFLADLFPLREDGEHGTQIVDPCDIQQKLTQIIASIPANSFLDAKNSSLLQDLSGPDPKGQISLALSKKSFWLRWGVHYLPSLLNAHQKQICNSFKDPGPLQYGTGSPLFIACRDKLDAAFDRLPAPTPSNYSTYRGVIRMSSYNSSNNPCFAGCTLVELASGRQVQICKLRRGIQVSTPGGPRKVAVVLKTPVQNETLCRIGNLLITRWHPVSQDGKSWSFPAHITDRHVRYTGAIYSVLLQRDTHVSAHAIKVAGLWGVSLGHGVTKGHADVRAHRFFGSYDRVLRSLRKLGVTQTGVIVGGGVRRNAVSGLASGFRRPAGTG
ncbi:U-box domain-containing protein [Pleurostoma richardsiae]|uniref:U-box domain-containing protein n=1 Tax=Pleurostoma richardsiae TaxID=41990 RepID=A0AA38RWS6_9PEZI|nr:U-box domain-containing protein [Pleurostoma richardsiae]